jgi:hypothetical protein
MRFMMLMIPRVYQGAESKNLQADFAPGAELVEKMMKYNEELAKSGALIALDGLQPPSKGARIAFSGGKPRVTDGPFTESTEVLGGYWIIQVGSREEAVDWARRCPALDGDMIEVRQIFEMADFPADVQKAAENPIVTSQIAKQKRS